MGWKRMAFTVTILVWFNRPSTRLEASTITNTCFPVKLSLRRRCHSTLIKLTAICKAISLSWGCVCGAQPLSGKSQLKVAASSNTASDFAAFVDITRSVSRHGALPLSAPCSGQVLAYKALLAADTLFAKSKAARNKGTFAKGLASGSYTFWSDSAVGVGKSTTDVDTTSFQGCLNATMPEGACATDPCKPW